MYLLLVGKKSAEKQSYDSFKSQSLKLYLDWIFWLIILYYIYGLVQAIPTYRVYWLYDGVPVTRKILHSHLTGYSNMLVSQLNYIIK